ncbi:MAG TPA: DMT family transporter [Anaerolineales bacterium]|nr:DMT family transporter [Anaerolineales bacterium]
MKSRNRGIGLNQEMAAFPSARLRADLLLLAASLIWGSAFVAQRIAATEMSVYLFNGLRFVLAGLILLPLARQGLSKLEPRALGGILLAGGVLFCGATLQQLGLKTTTAGNAGFITGLYVVLIPVILAVGWGHWPRRGVLAAVVLASIGLFLLSTGGRFVLAPGDALEFGGAILWAFHVILIGRLVKSVPVLPLVIGQNLVCGLMNLLVVGFQDGAAEWAVLPGMWFPIVYTGVFSIGVGYTFQALGQKEAPPSDAAVILSAEAVFAALFGWLLLDERLTLVQLAGCGLILAGMLLAQLDLRPGDKTLNIRKPGGEETRETSM